MSIKIFDIYVPLTLWLKSFISRNLCCGYSWALWNVYREHSQQHCFFKRFETASPLVGVRLNQARLVYAPTEEVCEICCQMETASCYHHIKKRGLSMCGIFLDLYIRSYIGYLCLGVRAGGSLLFSDFQFAHPMFLMIIEHTEQLLSCFLYAVYMHIYNHM